MIAERTNSPQLTRLNFFSTLAARPDIFVKLVNSFCPNTSSIEQSPQRGTSVSQNMIVLSDQHAQWLRSLPKIGVTERFDPVDISTANHKIIRRVLFYILLVCTGSCFLKLMRPPQSPPRQYGQRQQSSAPPPPAESTENLDFSPVLVPLLEAQEKHASAPRASPDSQLSLDDSAFDLDVAEPAQPTPTSDPPAQLHEAKPAQPPLSLSDDLDTLAAADDLLREQDVESALPAQLPLPAVPGTTGVTWVPALSNLTPTAVAETPDEAATAPHALTTMPSLASLPSVSSLDSLAESVDDESGNVPVPSADMPSRAVPGGDKRRADTGAFPRPKATSVGGPVSAEGALLGGTAQISRENAAATKIQAVFRGYRVRRSSKVALPPAGTNLLTSAAAPGDAGTQNAAPISVIVWPVRKRARTGVYTFDTYFFEFPHISRPLRRRLPQSASSLPPLQLLKGVQAPPPAPPSPSQQVDSPLSSPEEPPLLGPQQSPILLPLATAPELTTKPVASEVSHVKASASTPHEMTEASATDHSKASNGDADEHDHEHSPMPTQAPSDDTASGAGEQLNKAAAACHDTPLPPAEQPSDPPSPLTTAHTHGENTQLAALGTAAESSRTPGPTGLTAGLSGDDISEETAAAGGLTPPEVAGKPPSPPSLPVGVPSPKRQAVTVPPPDGATPEPPSTVPKQQDIAMPSDGTAPPASVSPQQASVPLPVDTPPIQPGAGAGTTARDKEPVGVKDITPEIGAKVPASSQSKVASVQVVSVSGQEELLPACASSGTVTSLAGAPMAQAMVATQQEVAPPQPQPRPPSPTSSPSSPLQQSPQPSPPPVPPPPSPLPPPPSKTAADAALSSSPQPPAPAAVPQHEIPPLLPGAVQEPAPTAAPVLPTPDPTPTQAAPAAEPLVAAAIAPAPVASPSPPPPSPASTPAKATSPAPILATVDPPPLATIAATSIQPAHTSDVPTLIAAALAAAIQTPLADAQTGVPENVPTCETEQTVGRPAQEEAPAIAQQPSQGDIDTAPAPVSTRDGTSSPAVAADQHKDAAGSVLSSYYMALALL